MVRSRSGIPKVGGRRHWLRAGFACVMIAIALVVGLTVNAVQGQARRSLETSRLAEEIKATAYALSTVEWRALSSDAIDSREEARHLSTALHFLASELPADVPHAVDLQDSADRYSSMIFEQLSAVASGNLADAKRIDRTGVDPAFESLRDSIQKVATAAAIQAKRSGTAGDRGTVGLLVIAAILMGLLYWGLDRMRQRAFRAYHDPLTGLANRALLTDQLEAALSAAAPAGARTAAVFLDLDDFKTLNDSMGHHAGDELLTTVAHRIRACVRDSDVVARFGGDEFVAMLRDVRSDTTVRQFCERVSEALHEPVVVAGRTIVPRATIGYALSDRDVLDAADLLRNADLAMYAGKRERKGSITAFAPEMHRRLIEQLELEDELRGALERNEMSVHYQPLVSLASGRILSTEALLRWTHPRLGPIPPLTFIPMAERTGLIHELGEWILNEACKQTMAWRIGHPLEPPLCVSVNVSALQLLDPTLTDRVQHALDGSGLAPACLTLEITESVIAEGNDAVIAQLHGLHALGVKLAVDDFGTGYSSLSTLHQFPINTLKIDKSFVDDVPNRKERLALLASIVDLGRSLGLQTVAEGVEGADQVSALQDLGCGQAQGYHFARPLTSHTLELLLGESSLPVHDTDAIVVPMSHGLEA